MKTRIIILMLLIDFLMATMSAAEQTTQSGGNSKPFAFEQDGAGRMQIQQTASGPTVGHKPPPQAFEDCKGKKAGDLVQHTTREGKVAATCLNSPDGLVARPNQPPSDRSSVNRSQEISPTTSLPGTAGKEGKDVP